MASTPLEEIRRLYFKTTAGTIDRDFDRAIDLLKSMPEEERTRATAYMHGLAEMRKEFGKGKGRREGNKGEGRREKGEGRREKGEGRK
jgi:hypothetical protein